MKFFLSVSYCLTLKRYLFISEHLAYLNLCHASQYGIYNKPYLTYYALPSDQYS